MHVFGENASGEADNQQGSRQLDLFDDWLTPQRLHAELLAASNKSLESYLQGALRDGTRSSRHRTHRIGQSDLRWLQLLKEALRILDYRSWIYKEGRSRDLWILETTAPFLSIGFDANVLIGAREGFGYVRGYFRFGRRDAQVLEGQTVLSADPKGLAKPGSCSRNP